MDFLNIVCVGSNIESLACLNSFKVNNIEISGLVTLPSKKEKRGSDYRDLSSFCNENNIPFFRTKNINSDNAKSWLRKINPDVIFILGWSQIFDDELISLPKKYIIGSHPSALPYGAGRAPVVWTILEGLRKSAVSFFKVKREVDAGNLVLQKHFSIPIMVNSKMLYDLVSYNLSEGFVEIYHQIINNLIVEEKQDMSKRTVRPKRVFEDGKLDFNKPASEVDKLVRAVTDPYPGTYSYYKGRQYTFWKSELSDRNNIIAMAGEILEIKNDKVLVQCLSSALYLYDITDFEGNATSASIFEIGQQFDLSL